MLYTSRPMWELEKTFLAQAGELRHRRGAIVANSHIEAAIGKRPTMEPEQREAVHTILKQEGSLRILTGVSGSGKTFVLDAVREAFEAAGYQVIGGALSGIAKEELAAQAHIKSRTAESYKYHLDKSTRQRMKDLAKHHAKQLLRAAFGKKTYQPLQVGFDKKTVLILDEAGMLDTPTLERFTHHIQKVEQGATLVLVGDPSQLSAIGPGGGFARLADTDPNAFHLRENKRQQNLLDREAVHLIREGQGAEALKIYADEGRLVVGKNSADVFRKMLDAWERLGGALDPARHVVLTQTRRQAEVANRWLQQTRQEQGLVAKGLGVRAWKGIIYRGDRILFEKSYRVAGIENGDRGTVLSANPLLGTITIHLDREKPGQKGKPFILSIPVRKVRERAISLAYAATTHKYQGQTIDENAYLLLSGHMADRELALVQATRAKMKTLIFVDETHAGPNLCDIAKAIEQSRAKKMAHDIVQTNRLKIPTDPELER